MKNMINKQKRWDEETYKEEYSPHKMQKYRLKKDIPGLKAGAIFTWDDLRGAYLHDVSEKIGYAFIKEDVENDTYWFEEIKEEVKEEEKIGLISVYSTQIEGWEFPQYLIKPLRVVTSIEEIEQIKSQIEQALEERFSDEELELMLKEFGLFANSQSIRVSGIEGEYVNKITLKRKLQQILAKRKGGGE